MKRLFVSLMVIGGFILFGMQTAESAPKKLTLRQRAERDRVRRAALLGTAIKCAKRAKTKQKGRCFRNVQMMDRDRARKKRKRLCGKLSPVAKKVCERRINVPARAKARALALSQGFKPQSQRREKCIEVNNKTERKSCFRKLQISKRARANAARVKGRVKARVKGRARTRAKGQRAGRPKAKLGCDRFTTERARKTCRGLPAARARAKAAGCSKIRDKDKKSICFRQAKMCGDLRDPKKIAKCRARVTPRHLGRKRCDRIKSLGARAACCAKIRPASRLSPKLCRPVSGPGSVKARARRPRGR